MWAFILIGVYTHHKFKTINPLIVNTLRGCLPLIAYLGYGIVLNISLSPYYCLFKDNNYTQMIDCWSLNHTITLVIGTVLAVLLFLLAWLTLILYIDTKSNPDNPSAKVNSHMDEYLLFVKTIVIITFCVIKESDDYQWFIIVLMLILSSYLFVVQQTENTYYNESSKLMYNIFGIICLWTNVVLFLGKVLINSSYNSSFPLVIIGYPIIVLIYLYHSFAPVEYLIKNLDEIDNVTQALLKINYLLNVISLTHIRNNRIFLMGYIDYYEETCPIKNCALQRYLKNDNPNIDSTIFLLQHCKVLYLRTLRKFPDNITLKFSYADFVYHRLNQKQLAYEELYKCRNIHLSLQDQFVLYRYIKILDESSESKKERGDNTGMNGSTNNLEYLNHFNSFKTNISKASNLYLDFWSLLLNPSQNPREDLTKLNILGSKINICVDEINFNFEKIIKIKSNDKPALKLYSDFLNDVLNDKDKSYEYKQKLRTIDDSGINDKEDNVQYNPIDDFYYINADSDFQYIVVSKGRSIINFSLGVCQIFGYSKNELLGKDLNTIIPPILQNGHNEALDNEYNNTQKKLMELGDPNLYKPEYKDMKVFGINKLNYLVKLQIKVAVLVSQDDINDCTFLAQIWSNSIITALMKDEENACYILTDTNFIIQTFTPNSEKYLKLRSDDMDSNIDIIECIKQISDKVNEAYRNIEKKSPERRLKLKKDFINKLVNQTLGNIYWQIKRRYTNKLDSKNEERFSASITSNIDLKSTNPQSNYRNIFRLTISDIKLNNKVEGYIFKLSPFDSFGKYLGSTKTNDISQQKNFFSNSINQNSSIDLNLVSNNKTNTNEGYPGDYSIKGDFIPQSDLIFQLNEQLESFIGIKSTSSQFPLFKNKLKNDAEQKAEYIKNLNVQNNIKKKKLENFEEDEEEGEEEDDEEFEEEEDEEDNNNNNNNSNKDNEKSHISSKDGPDKNTIKNIKKNIDDYKNKINENFQNYTKINTTKIKVMQYDYEKHLVKEIKDFVRDQVVQKENERNELMASIKAKSNTTDLKSKVKKSDTEVERKKNAELKRIEDEKKELIDIKKKELLSQIEYALKKKDSHTTMIVLKIYSFFYFTLYILCGLLFFLFTHSILSKIKLQIQSIINFHTLKVANAYGAMFVRELTLLNDDNYEGYRTDIYTRDSFTEFIFNGTKEIYNEYFNDFTYIITNDIMYSKEDINSVFYIRINVVDILDSLDKNIFELNLINSLSSINFALYYISRSDLEDIYPTEKNVYYFFYNSINFIYTYITKLSDVYYSNLLDTMDSLKIRGIYITVITLVVLIILVVIFGIVFEKVSKTKESYLEIFFQISKKVIKISLDKCDNFIKKINIEDENKSIKEDESSYQEDSYIDEGISNKHKENKHIHIPSNDNNKTNKETKIFRLKISILSIVVLILNIIIFVVFIQKANKLKIFTNIYSNIIIIETKFLFFFNAIRERLFDQNSYVMNTTVTEYVTSKKETIMSEYETLLTYIEDNEEKLSGTITEKITTVNTNNICELINSDSSAIQECTSLLSYSPKYGLLVSFSSLFEELRTLDSMIIDFLNTLNNENCTLNFTLLGLNDTSYFNCSNSAINPWDIYNSEQHKNVSYVLRKLFMVVFNDTKLYLNDAFYNETDYIENLFMIIYIVFALLVLLFYLFVWINYQNKLNQTIYKTKYMLSIIPKEVLGSLNGIKKILGISQNYIKRQNFEHSAF